MGRGISFVVIGATACYSTAVKRALKHLAVESLHKLVVEVGDDIADVQRRPAEREHNGDLHRPLAAHPRCAGDHIFRQNHGDMRPADKRTGARGTTMVISAQRTSVQVRGGPPRRPAPSGQAYRCVSDHHGDQRPADKRTGARGTTTATGAQRTSVQVRGGPPW